MQRNLIAICFHASLASLLITHMYIFSVIRHTVAVKRESEAVICVILNPLSHFKSLTRDA